MTARERKASEGTSATLTAQSAARETARCAARNGADNAHLRAFAWEEWFAHAGPSQRDELLALAARQGLIYASQIPPPINGTSKPVSEISSHACARLLSGKHVETAPILVEPVEVLDQNLDCAQREAVARALATPDVFLLEGLPGTGRSRVLAEILNQSARRGEKALFLAKDPAALDVVLSRLTDGLTAFPIRYLDPAENPAALPSTIASLTPAQRPRVFKERTLHNAATAKADSQRQVHRRQAEEPCWLQLRSIAEQVGAAQQRLRDAESRLAAVASEVQHDATAEGPHGEALKKVEEQRTAQLEALRVDLDKKSSEAGALTAQLDELANTIGRLRPMAQAKEEGRFWTFAWWRALFGGRVLAKITALEERRSALDCAVQENTRAQAEIKQASDRACQAFDAERNRVVEAETERRRQDRLGQVEVRQQEISELMRAWHKHKSELDIPDHRPVEATAAALAVTRERWEKQRQADVQAHEFACRFEAFARESVDGLATRVSEWATVFAGTMNALAQDRSFAEVASGPFDVLILEDADQFTEADLLNVGRHAARWVLVAEGPVPAVAGAASANGNGKSLPALPGCFAKLWRLLHQGPGSTPYVWSWENGCLCCTLRTLTAEERSRLETERVADFPEIELRILVAAKSAMPKVAPAIAQVVFPAQMSLAEAKRFIYRELEEAAVQTAGRCAWLGAGGDGLRLHLSPLENADAECLELEPGLREWLTPGSVHTCRLDFSVTEGWTPARARQWLTQHLNGRDSGRTMSLRVPYRMPEGLACAVNAILFERGYLCNARAEAYHHGLEFVAVPPMRTDAKLDNKRKAAAPAGPAALPCEAAGLELDLSSPHGADRMPADLRAELPRRGVANYLEAQALIRRLEDLAQEGADGPVAVIALQEGQAHLLRRLASRSECLRRQGTIYEIGTPAEFSHREWPTVLVSLTRSHGRRVMAYGEGASDLIHAFTRAQKRLVVFGDVGHLVKRSQCQGPLDRLDAGAAAAEGRVIRALVAWLTDTSRKIP